MEPDTLNPHSDIHPSMVIERPKVIYNDETGKFVMWMHIDSYNYWKAAAGVAVSDSPTGKFTYLRSMPYLKMMMGRHIIFIRQKEMQLFILVC